MKKLVTFFVFAFLFPILLFIVVPSSVSAIGKPGNINRPNAASKTATARGEEKRQLVQNRLPEIKLKACQAREKAIKKRTEQLVKLATTMQEKFAAIAGRVEEYYVSKVVPSGKTVANYESLIADIQAKKGEVQTALTTAQNNAGAFACDSNDPKRQLMQFREDMKAVKSALKDYRTSIKNLIVAAHSVTGATERNNSASPKPTKTEGENE